MPEPRVFRVFRVFRGYPPCFCPLVSISGSKHARTTGFRVFHVFRVFRGYPPAFVIGVH